MTIDHNEAWDVAHTNRDSSNLARAYIELREIAQECVDHPDNPIAIRKLREVCETNRD